MDPFEYAKNELVNDSLSLCNAYYERFRQLTSGSSSIDQDQVEWTRNELMDNIKSALWELQELEETVLIVERQPQKYSIPDYEIKNRRDFIENTKNSLNRMQNHLESHSSSSGASFGDARKQQQKSDREELLKQQHTADFQKDRYDILDDQMERDNQAFIDQQMLRQREVIDQQDHHLDRVIDGTTRLKNLVLDIGDELDEHKIIIEDLQTDVERTQSNLGRVQRKLNKLLKSASGDKGKLICIVVLFIILGVLVLLVAFA
mmetsp:Transcript_10181/g.37862  ORF Transcript_10181/g.37862 Transcript_10181/m.37862 type:complete len:261 (-) Transcript_10181:655-1437(-)|eukprot:CAMPEP_0117444102 /NCGR_PEP_ID=MMETSP0759-20121206/5056_1 /TAXON_ID=63605 /ORGANISM="Percolomonas cosmopolitus, Strain WS" /LENGTH=260 /DNA_ID=CAMNT_0005236135 /DNA_START=1148 /DNA_END=1930 /DNA_ORIENTATION=-